MYNIDISTCILADINNMGCEKTRLSFTLKTNTPNSLSNHAVWTVSLSLLTVNEIVRKWPENTMIADCRTTDCSREEETQNIDSYNTNCSKKINILAILCSWVCWFQSTRRQIFSRREPYIYLFYWVGSKYDKQNALHERKNITQVNIKR